MAESKRFYWIKLKTDFFNLDEIDFLLGQKNGCEYVVLYQMLCLKTANNNGRLCTTIGEMMIPFDVEKIIRETKHFDFDTVTIALELFKKLGLIFEENDGVFKISAVDEMVGSEGSSAQRVRKHRESKALQCNTDVTKKVLHCNTEIEYRDKSIEIRDKSIDKEQETDKEFVSDETKSSRKKIVRCKHGEYDNVLLSDEEYEKLKVEFPEDYQDRIERLSEYMASTGKTYKNHLATIRCWARKNQSKASSTQSVKQPQSEYDRFMSNLQEIYNESE